MTCTKVLQKKSDEKVNMLKKGCNFALYLTSE